MPLKDRTRRPVIGRRIAVGRPGRKGAQGRDAAPSQLDHFEITGAGQERDGTFVPLEAENSELRERYGAKPRKVPIFVPSDNEDDWLSQDYELRQKVRDVGLRVWCRGDGETAQRMVSRDQPDETRTVPCRAHPSHTERNPRELAAALKNPWADDPQTQELRCPFAQNREPKLPSCKPVTEALVHLGIRPSIGTLDRFRSHGHMTADALRSSLDEVKAHTGGFLQGVPLRLALTRRKTERPGGGVAVHSVVHVELNTPVEKARELIALRARQEHEWQITAAESRKLLKAADDLDEQEAEWPSAPSPAEAEKPSGSMPDLENDTIDATFTEEGADA